MSVASYVKDLVATIRGEKARAYRAVFDLQGDHGREAERVLADLRKFCLAEASTFATDAQLAAHRQGKREVWLRLNYYLNLTDREVHRLREVESDYVDDE